MISGSIELHKFLIPKDKLKNIPKQELVFFLKSMDALTEIHILQKWIVFSSNPFINGSISMESVETTAQSMQALFAARLLAGVLNEACNLIHDGFFGSLQPVENEQLQNLRQIYEPLMNDAERDKLKKITSYFSSQDNIMKFIRNEFAFHFDFEETFKRINDLIKNSETELLFSEADGNCLYIFAHQSLIFTLIGRMGYLPEGLREATNKFMADITNLARSFADFFGGFIAIFLRKYFDIKLSDLEKIEIERAPLISEVILPYFARPNETD